MSIPANNTAIRGIPSTRSTHPLSASPADSEASRRKTVALSVATNSASMGMAGVASILAARLLGPQGRGQLAAIVVWASLAAALGDLGISQACGYYGAQRPREAGMITGTAIALSIAAAAVLLTLFQPFGNRIFGRELAGAAKFYLFSVPVSMTSTCLSTMMLGLGYFGRFNLIKMVQAAGYVAGIGSAWVVGSARVGGILNGILLFQVVAAVVALCCTVAVVPLAAWGASAAVARELLSYGFRTYAGNLFWLANGRLDQALLVWLAPMHELGIYAVAVSYSGLLFGVSGAVATVAFSRAARARSDEGGRLELWRGLSLLGVLTLPLAAVMAWLARYAITTVYGTAFAAACLPANILLLGGLFLGVNYVSSNCMRAGGRPGIPVLAEAGGLIVTVLALPFALPRWGITGAAWVSVASYATTAACLTVLWMLHGISMRRSCPVAEAS